MRPNKRMTNIYVEIESIAYLKRSKEIVRYVSVDIYL